MQVDYAKALYKDFCGELIILLECLRLVQLTNTSDQIDIPDSWGSVPDRYTVLSKTITRNLSLKGHHIPDKAAETEHALREMFGQTEPLFPGAIFQSPNSDLVKNAMLTRLLTDKKFN